MKNRTRMLFNEIQINEAIKALCRDGFESTLQSFFVATTSVDWSGSHQRKGFQF